MDNFDRIVTVVNPNATRHEDIQMCIADIRRNYLRHDYMQIVTTAESRSTIEAIQENLADRTLVVGLGGEYVANVCVNALVGSDAKHTVLAQFPLGNGNNFARPLLGDLPEQPSSLIKHGQPRTIYPLDVNFEQPDGNTERLLAAAHVGLGWCGAGAKALNAAKQRTRFLYGREFVRHWVYESAAVGRIALSSEPFHVEREDGHSEWNYDLLFSNGPDYAKWRGLPIHLSDRAFLEVRAAASIENCCVTKGLRRAASMTSWVANGTVAMLRSKPSGEAMRRIEPSQEVRLKLLGKTAVLGQIDAEPIVVQPGTVLKISQHAKAFRALAL